tara:strand:+ start:311 stop:472 length:162 start_codon:yes stop_codon:yes gene_type:complete
MLFKSGAKTSIPSKSGNKMRFVLCKKSDMEPLFCHIIAVKKPLTKKKSGIRKP